MFGTIRGEGFLFVDLKFVCPDKWLSLFRDAICFGYFICVEKGRSGAKANQYSQV